MSFLLNPFVFAVAGASRFLAGGGYSGSNLNTIDYVEVATTGNATDFGDLTVARRALSGVAATTRGLFSGGFVSANSNVIDYVTIATAGNATDFGDLSANRRTTGNCASSTRGFFVGGFEADVVDTIEYVTFATIGNTTNFGDLDPVRQALSGASSTTRAVLAGGQQKIGSTYSSSNDIEYITMASAGNAVDFGDLTLARRNMPNCGGSSDTRAVFSGGFTDSPAANVNNIDYVTIATTGNATDFGDLTVARRNAGSGSSTTRCLTAGGIAASGSNIIDYVEIATAGNATDFGDLNYTSSEGIAGFANYHGGV